MYELRLDIEYRGLGLREHSWNDTGSKLKAEVSGKKKYYLHPLPTIWQTWERHSQYLFKSRNGVYI